MLHGFFAGLMALMFSASFIKVLIVWFDFSSRLHDSWTTPVVLAGLALTAYAAVNSTLQRPKYGVISAISLLLGVLVLGPFLFMYDVFGTYDFGSFLATMHTNPPKELLTIGFGSLSEKVIEHLLVATTLIACGAYLVWRIPYFSVFAGLVGLLFLVVNPLATYAYRLIVSHPAHALIQIPGDVHPLQI